jgi:hypothetical protein
MNTDPHCRARRPSDQVSTKPGELQPRTLARSGADTTNDGPTATRSSPVTASISSNDCTRWPRSNIDTCRTKTASVADPPRPLQRRHARGGCAWRSGTVQRCRESSGGVAVQLGAGPTAQSRRLSQPRRLYGDLASRPRSTESRASGCAAFRNRGHDAPAARRSGRPVGGGVAPRDQAGPAPTGVVAPRVAGTARGAREQRCTRVER